MIKLVSKTVAIAAIIFAAFTVAHAEEAKETPVVETESAESYIQRAKEFLPYSCEGLVEEFEGDEAGLEEAMKLLIAVSVINREIVWEEVVKTPEEEAAIGKKLEFAITKECEADVETLMAGAVDRAVVAAFAE